MKKLLYIISISFFSYTLMNKVLIYDSFLLNIAKTGIFSHYQVYIVSVIAILLEAVSILLLCLKKYYGLVLSLSMMSLFTLYIIVLYAMGRYEVCGCGGIMNGLDFKSHLFVNILLICIIVYLLKDERLH